MWPCPSLPANISHSEFWELASRDPVPRVIPGLAPATDFISEFGQPAQGGGATFEFAKISPSGTRYVLSNPGPRGSSSDSRTFAALPKRYPLPEPLRSINLTPMVSVGLQGTGQTDLARHYHGVTAMRLLQGVKIWALRPPNDPECLEDAGNCTDPFDVCEHYRAWIDQKDTTTAAPLPAPTPACVQRAGDTLMIPDGWHHGTCNAVDGLTIGWGGQNRRFVFDPPPKCRHCRLAGPHRFATATAEEILSRDAARRILSLFASEATQWPRQNQRPDCSYRGDAHRGEGFGDAMCRDKGQHARQLRVKAVSVRYSVPSVPLGFRGLFMQFAQLDMAEASRLPSFMDPECYALQYGGDGDGEGGSSTQTAEEALEEGLTSWLRSPAHLFVYSPVYDDEDDEGHSDAGSARLWFVDRASGEVEVRSLPHRTAAMWRGGSLVGLSAGPHVVIDELPDAHGSSGQIDADPAPTLFGTSAVSPGIAAYEVTPLNQRSGDESRTHQVGVVCRMINPSLQ